MNSKKWIAILIIACIILGIWIYLVVSKPTTQNAPAITHPDTSMSSSATPATATASQSNSTNSH